VYQNEKNKVENIYIGLLVYTGGGWCLEEPVLRQTVYAFKYGETVLLEVFL
jgi:hypothetical protein